MVKGVAGEQPRQGARTGLRRQDPRFSQESTAWANYFKPAKVRTAGEKLGKKLALMRFVEQSDHHMQSDRAAEHLQVIRTLMERSALYRRALAPVMIFAGAVGLIAALAGWWLSISRGETFVAYWLSVGALALAGALLLVRRQALQSSEPFWSPPTRRVALAVSPALVAGFVVGLLVFILPHLPEYQPAGETSAMLLVSIPAFWLMFYGCALHAAGFFATRGMRLFGWVITISGCLAFPLQGFLGADPWLAAHGLMGLFFGGLHLAYGTYLYFTEPRGNET